MMIKAAQFSAPGQVELTNIPMPVCEPHQVLIRFEKLTICGSDVSVLYEGTPGDFPFKPGMTGHECVGVVEESQVSEVRPGDRMLVIPPEANAFSEFLAIEPRWLIPLPDGLESELGVLAQQLGTVIHCCRKLGNVIDKTVVIVGQGPAGLFFTTLFSHMGAQKIIVFDIVDHRLEFARQMGAHYAFNAGQVDPIKIVQELTDGHLADLAVEAVGRAETINLCPDLVRSQGELALFGVPEQAILPFAYEKFFRKQLRTYSSVYTQLEPGFRSFRLALELIAQKRVSVAPFITHRFPFNEIGDAFHVAQTKTEGAIKILIDFTRK